MHNKIINGYTLLRFLGKGGMAEVWYAENKLGKPAAIKIMLPKYVGEEQVILRFESEAKAMVVLDHPNIRKVFDFGEVDSRPFIIMEYLEGSDLATFIQNKKKPNIEQLKIWWQQALNALQNTHNKGIIHRDIKPSNIFLCNDGNIKLLDFGIAKVKDSVISTHTGSRLGSLQYMSPEQIIDPKRVQPNTDIFSLAVSFVHLLKGKIPYAETDSDFKLQNQIVNGELDLKGISTEWLTILQPCLQKDPKLRIQTAMEALNNFTKNTDTNEDTKIDITNNTIDTIEENPTPEKKQNQMQYKYIVIVALLFVISCIILFLFKDSKTTNTTLKSSLVVSDTLRIKREEDSLREQFFKRYDYVGLFQDGLALVKLNGKYGFIDKTGIEVIPLKYDDAISFQNGLAHVRLNGKHGFINKTAQVIIPFIYTNAESFSEDLAKVAKNGKWGFIDKLGQEIIPFIYEDGNSFSEGLALVELNGKHGFINKSGNEVIPFIYQLAYSFSQGLARVLKNNKWGVIDKRGQEVIPFIYSDVDSFSESLAKCLKNGKYGFLDKTGQEIIPFIYDYANSFSEGLAKVQKNGKCGFIDKLGHEIIPFIYENTGSFTEGLAMAQLNAKGKWGYIDKIGNEVIPFIFYEPSLFSEGLSKIYENNKYGFIDKTGNVVIPVIYDYAHSFEDGLAYVRLNNNWFYFNKNGECVSKNCTN